MTEQNEELKIEKGIPLPSSTRTLKRMELIKGMEVGDSFLDHGSSSLTVNSRWRHVFKKLKFKCAVRSAGGGQFRIWRTK